jgi:hypothetical protein
MSEPLVLTTLLTSPPQGSPPEITASITLRCDALGIDHISGLLHDPLTQQDRNDLHWYLEEYGSGPIWGSQNMADEWKPCSSM